MTTRVPSTTPSEDPYSDWRTEIERITGEPNCSRCYGKGYTGLSKLPGGKTMLVACRCMKVTQYPLDHVVRDVVREEMAILHGSFLAAREEARQAHETLVDRLAAMLQIQLTAWWRRVFKW